MPYYCWFWITCPVYRFGLAVLWIDKVIKVFPGSDLYSRRNLFNIQAQESLYSCMINPLSSEEEFILRWFYFWGEGSLTALLLWVCFCCFWKISVTNVYFKNLYKPHTLPGHLIFYIQDAVKIQLWSCDTTSVQWEDITDFSGHWIGY